MLKLLAFLLYLRQKAVNGYRRYDLFDNPETAERLFYTHAPITPMRIVQVVHAFPPEVGGLEHHVFYLSRELVRKGHDVLVVAGNPGGLKSEETMDGVRVRRYRSFAFPGFSSVRLQPGLLLRLLFVPADVFHSHGYGSLHPLCAALAALLRRKPFFFTLHGYPKMTRLKEKAMLWLYRNFIARIYLAIARKVISVSEDLSDIEREVARRKVAVIPNGADTELFKPSKTEERKTIITYVGRFDRYKGIDVLVRAFAQVVREFPDVELHIVGKDEGMRSELERLARELGVEGKTMFYEELEKAKMPEVYNRSSLVVLPSYYEGFSLVMLEALLCRRPMLATQVGMAEQVMRMAFGRHADMFLVKPGDVDGLAEKMRAILGARERLGDILKKASERIAAEYSWPAVADRTLELYQSS